MKRLKGVYCILQPCADDNEDERSLIQQRASDVCAALKATSWYGSDKGLYLSTGDRYHSQCKPLSVSVSLFFLLTVCLSV